MWQTPLGQCPIATFQQNAEAGRVPCCGSLAVAQKLIGLPTAQVSAGSGVTVPSVGAALPAWICWVAVDGVAVPVVRLELRGVGARGVGVRRR